MTAEILRPPQVLTDAEALRISQQAPQILQSQDSWSWPYPLSLIFASDDPEKWQIYENTFYSCLRTGDNKSAFACLEKLKRRFGETNERVMGLTGIYHEAICRHNGDLEALLKEYDDVIAEKPTNMGIRKRRIALLRSMSHSGQAASALNDLLEASPTDAEAWAELADLYFAEGLYSQAVFSLEEVLLIVPNAWNMHARLGEVIYVSTLASGGNELATAKGLARAVRCFSRSIELCDDYLRGYYGLKLTTSKLLLATMPRNTKGNQSSESAEDDLPLPDTSSIQSLNQLATSKLAEIVRRFSSGEQGWQGYNESEIISARELLDRDTQAVTR